MHTEHSAPTGLLRVVDKKAISAELKAVVDAIGVAKMGCRSRGLWAEIRDGRSVSPGARDIAVRRALAWRDDMPRHQRELHHLRKMATELHEALAHLRGKYHQVKFSGLIRFADGTTATVAAEKLAAAQATEVAPVLDRFSVYVDAPPNIESGERTYSAARTTIDLKRCPSIEIDPNRHSGKPVLKGTRFPVAQILAELAEGDVTLKRVCEDFNQSEDTVRQAMVELSALLDEYMTDERN